MWDVGDESVHTLSRWAQRLTNGLPKSARRPQVPSPPPDNDDWRNSDDILWVRKTPFRNSSALTQPLLNKNISKQHFPIKPNKPVILLICILCLTLMLLVVAYLANTKWCKNLKNDCNHGKCVLIWEYSARAFQWIPTWQGLEGFQNFLHFASLCFGRKLPLHLKG